MKNLNRLSLVVALLAASNFATAFANVHVVAPSGGDFATVQAAVDAAIEGDTILVRPGAFGGFTIQGKSLSVVGDGAVVINDRIFVRNLAVGQWCSLASLRSVIPASFGSAVDHAALRVENVAGSLRVRECELTGAAGPNGTSSGTVGHHAVYIATSSGNVAFAACTITGGRAGAPTYESSHGRAGGHGLLVIGVRVAVHDCTITGGRGGDTIYATAANGAPAVESLSGGGGGTGVFVCGSTLLGGRGGDSYEDVFADFTYPGNGGDGLVMASGTVAQIRDNVLVGGAPGIGVNCIPVTPPVAGVPSSGAGVFYTLPAPRIVLTVPSIVREGTTMHVRVSGTPGDTAYLDSGREPKFQVVPSFGGVILVAHPAPPKILILGTIPLSGTFETDLPIPGQSVGVQAHQRHLQAFTRDALGAKTLGSFAVVTIVDAAY